MKGDDLKICEQHLAKVSRTFAINIQVLRGDVYRALLIAYLLCRIADTLEDDPLLPAEKKIGHLNTFAGLFPPSSGWDARTRSFVESVSFGTVCDDSVLVGDMPRVFRELLDLPVGYVDIISEYVKEMALGMADFQKKTSEGSIVCLNTEEELKHYCYYVAGTVGLMITSIFSKGAPRITEKIEERLISRSVKFGIGLQLTNISKDFFPDLRRGWCYVPKSYFEAEGITLNLNEIKSNRVVCMRIFKRLTNLALENLDEALFYTLDIPRACVRYRLFCLWPLFMAIKTLIKLNEQNEDLLDGHKIKISRNEVKKIMVSTSFAVVSNNALMNMYRHLKAEYLSRVTEV
ncbi:MAG: phytoene/squalene synthase family protein [Syntrophales bacterium]|jgi:farnesyl-diphosphate farnesyltransferase|nr:phytoene/squalene synthase family protein [Syntrophales bacterium]MDY0043504.1 phytoene/squalene synthase family protein [Syntrophales bacterium]